MNVEAGGALAWCDANCIGDLASGGHSAYMGAMNARLEIRPHRHDHGSSRAECCAGHAVPPAETVAAAERLCRERGLRLTDQRRAVLGALAESRKPLGAYDLIEILRGRGEGRAPAPIAIYRALDFLGENGFIHRLESLNAFIACPHRHGAGEGVVFLICERCHHVEEAVGDRLNAALAALAGEHDFAPRRQVIEVAGLCRTCAAHERA